MAAQRQRQLWAMEVQQHNMQNNIDPTTMNSAQLGQAAANAFNDPAAAAAQNQVNTAQGAYTQQLNDNGTLPQMLSNSLNGSLSNTQDPMREQDLATLLTGLHNPSSAINDAETMVLPQAELQKQPGVINASAQSAVMAGKLGLAAARLSTDNNMLSARGMGITGLLGVFSNYMANHTQALLSAVQNAQNNRDYLFQKASTLGNMALSLSQLKQSAEQFKTTTGLKQQELNLEREGNPLIQGTAARGQAVTDLKAGKYQDFKSFYGAVKDDPRLSGMSDQDIWQLYTTNGGKGNIPTDLQIQTGIRSGHRWQDFVNTGSITGPVGAGVGMAGGALQAAGGILPYMIMAGL